MAVFFAYHTYTHTVIRYKDLESVMMQNLAVEKGIASTRKNTKKQINDGIALTQRWGNGRINTTHKGNASKFNELFVKTGIFPKQFSQYLTSAMDKRSKGDYDIFSVIDFDLAKDLLQTAHVFKAALQGYLEENGFCGE
jgi:hypothetical protein